MTVAELLGRISSEELTEWMAYELAEGPLGPARGDWHAALVASNAMNIARRGKGRTAKVTDFLLKWTTRGKSSSSATAASSEAMGKMLASRLGGTWTEGRKTTGGETG